MRVLWTTNLVAMPDADLLDPANATFGGWVSAMLRELSGVNELQLGVVARSPVSELRVAHRNTVPHYYVPQSRRDPLAVDAAACRAALDDFRPDILHAEGAEMAYTRQFLKAWPGRNVVSMQGILRGYEPYEHGDLPLPTMLLGIHRPRRALMAAALTLSKAIRFRPRLASEAESIALAKNILGRTRWDYAHAKALNSLAPYYSVSRVLRPDFYEHTWCLENAVPRSIFIGNSAQPRKGAHFVLEAVAALRPRFPDVTLVIAGEKPEVRSFRDLKKAIGYPAYLLSRMRELELENVVRFTGVLKAGAMAQEMARSHAFVLASLIENSPNTLGEAMIMGVPCVSAYAGGAPDMAAPDREALFYRPNDSTMLAEQLARIFSDEKLARALSTAARHRGRNTHDPIANREKLIAAYRAMMATPTENSEFSL